MNKQIYDKLRPALFRKGQVRTGQDWSGLVRTGQDWSGLVSTGQDWSVLVGAVQDWSGLIRTGRYNADP